MAADDRIAAALPPPPRPAPGRRAEAIGAAMRRFDGGRDSPAAAVGGARPARWWSNIGYRQAGAFASVALVALIGLPLAWQSMNGPFGFEEKRPVAELADRAPAGASAELDAEAVAPQPRSQSLPAAQPAPVAPGDVAPTAAPPVPAAPVAAPPAVQFAEASPPPAESRSAEPAAPAGVERERSEAQQADAVALAARDMRVKAMPPAVGRMAAPALAPESSIVISGFRARPDVPKGRGDWNACTVDDPLRSLERCRHLVDPSAEGAAGRAGAQLADGLSSAWQGDLEVAIRAFDRAIEQAPNPAFAYLNRGLAHRRNGDLDRAVADLDEAVRHDPNSARAYYSRSLVLRQQGENARARADEKRALALDPRYSALVDEDPSP